MKRIIRLTESDLARIVKRVMNEQNEQPLMKLDFPLRKGGPGPAKMDPNYGSKHHTYTGSKEGDIEFFQSRSTDRNTGPASAIQQIIGMDNGDGINGPITKKCIKFYQKMNGLPVDGVVGPDTAAALYKTTLTLRPFLFNFQPKNEEEQKMKQYCQSVQMSSQTGSRY
jgi:murein L,D-transpeptidase YcbB/YkuD